MAEGIILDAVGKPVNAPTLCFDPLGDRYLVRAEDPKKFMEGPKAAILLEGYTEKTLGWKAGVVLEVGDGHLLEREERVAMAYKPGDIVMIYHNAGHEVFIGGHQFVVVSQKEILGRFRLDEGESTS